LRRSAAVSFDTGVDILNRTLRIILPALLFGVGCGGDEVVTGKKAEENQSQQMEHQKKQMQEQQGQMKKVMDQRKGGGSGS